MLTNDYFCVSVSWRSKCSCPGILEDVKVLRTLKANVGYPIWPFFVPVAF